MLIKVLDKRAFFPHVLDAAARELIGTTPTSVVSERVFSRANCNVQHETRLF